jgi:hypothetical protein
MATDCHKHRALTESTEVRPLNSLPSEDGTKIQAKLMHKPFERRPMRDYQALSYTWGFGFSSPTGTSGHDEKNGLNYCNDAASEFHGVNAEIDHRDLIEESETQNLADIGTLEMCEDDCGNCTSYRGCSNTGEERLVARKSVENSTTQHWQSLKPITYVLIVEKGFSASDIVQKLAEHDYFVR